MPVTIESAGSHAFDLGHLRRQGGAELVQLLLHKAGLKEELPWRLQVQKKLFCNGETPPVRVVDEPKKWAVYLKIKPGDNNSCHYCSLLMPDGLQGQQIYGSLKKAELLLDRNWRYSAVEETEQAAPRQDGAPIANGMPEEATFAPPTENLVHDRPEKITAEVPATASTIGESPTMPPPKDLPKPRGTVKGWVGDDERTRLILLAIHEVNAKGFHSQEHFVELLSDKLGWEGANRYEIGGVFTSLVRKDYIIRKMRGSRAFGYEVTEEGRKVIRDLLEPAAPAASANSNAPAPQPAVDRVQTIRAFGPVAMQFMEASDRLDQITARAAQLSAELEALRKEESQICKFLEDPEIQKSLASLLALRRS